MNFMKFFYLSFCPCRMCGHRDLGVKYDDKAFGFPFDRKISFKLDNSLK